LTTDDVFREEAGAAARTLAILPQSARLQAKTEFPAPTGAPRETLLFALDLFESEPGGERFAVDLGCGEGRDTAELLRRGWRVLAIDAEREAIERLRARPDLDPDAAARLESRLISFEESDWRGADLVNSSFALPFCPPDRFPALWERIASSLRRGGRFSGQLFGERDGWAEDPGLSFHRRADLEDLLQAVQLERLDEIEEDGKTALGEPKHWHVFHIVARKL
jgi:tellurite methyltransferase